MLGRSVALDDAALAVVATIVSRGAADVAELFGVIESVTLLLEGVYGPFSASSVVCRPPVVAFPSPRDPDMSPSLDSVPLPVPPDVGALFVTPDAPPPLPDPAAAPHCVRYALYKSYSSCVPPHCAHTCADSVTKSLHASMSVLMYGCSSTRTPQPPPMTVHCGEASKRQVTASDGDEAAEHEVLELVPLGLEPLEGVGELVSPLGDAGLVEGTAFWGLGTAGSVPVDPLPAEWGELPAPVPPPDPPSPAGGSGTGSCSEAGGSGKMGS